MIRAIVTGFVALSPKTAYTNRCIVQKMSSSGLLACQLDSYKTQGTSKVVSCDKVGDLYQVVLEDSVLYPEGGGQPWDFGYVAGTKVEKVVKYAGNKQVLVELPNPAEVGSEVSCKVDWERRYDIMQQHTAQVCIVCFVLTLQFGWLTI
jgi:misacylated tRNA(Ala) deacylase